MKRGERWALRAGGALFAIGFLLVTFVAYQLWGTGIYESHAQANLRHDLSSTLHRTLPVSAAPTVSSANSLPPLATHTAPVMAAPAIGAAVGLLSIPKIGLNDAIVEGVGEAELEQGPGHYQGTALPGEPGNVAIAGHRTTYAHPFYNLNVLSPGDLIFILTEQGLFRYSVTGTQVVAPSDIAVLTSATNSPTLTLTTCNPRYSASTRLVVTAAFDPAAPTIGGTTTTVPATTPATSSESLKKIAGDSLGGATASAGPAILWSAITMLIAFGVWMVWRRVPRKVRWLIAVIGIPLVVLCLLTSYEHISLALPGSF